MKNFLSSLLATLVGLLIMTLVVFLIFMGIVAASTSKEVPDVKENSLLVAKFDARIIDRADYNPLSKLVPGNFAYDELMGLEQILKDLEKARNDDKINGIFLRLGNVPTGISTLSEVRDALLDFKSSGKFIYAYADIFTQKSYYLATAADSIFMTPEGMFMLTGLSAEATFYKNALDKLGIEMQVVKHGSYKSAAESFTRESLSDENREQIEGYVGGIWKKMVSDISESRGIPEEKLNLYADELVSMENKKLVETGMIDSLMYYDEMLSLMKKKLGVEEKDDLDAIGLKSYKDIVSKEKKDVSRDKIAVVYAMGMVVDGNAGEGNIGSERIAKAIRKARRDKTVKAIVFRINSGGGSVVASDVIYREALLAAKEKPFVASMGDVAASGGYYIAAPADTILASPSTITGSIGVIFSMPNMKELMNDKLGVTTDVVKTNRHADIFTVFDPLDPQERHFIQKSVDDAYENFVNLVADNRNLSFDEIDAIAGGRVWSGTDALDLGLVDMFGGLGKSIEVAAEMAGLENYRLQSLPKLEDPFTALLKELTGGARMKAIEKELGSEFIHYKNIQEISKMHGLQAIMPFHIELQ
ncbi:MAG: signal peptide peptidase SppA [Bacteroidota bacterium]